MASPTAIKSPSRAVGQELARRGPSRLPAIAVVLLALTATARIITTYHNFSQTLDEGPHVACGMQWWQDHRYDLEPLHPPLARIFVAALPYFSGIRVTADGIIRGNDVFDANGRYIHNLTLARLGTLPFFLLGVWATWRMAGQLHGTTAAVFSVLLLTTSPPVLAHAGLATTDMALTATLTLALYAFVMWLDSPTIKWSLFLGGSIALGFVSKLSALAFLPAATVALLIACVLSQRASARHATSGSATGFPLRNLLLAGLVMFVVMWAAYRFAVHPYDGVVRLRFSEPLQSLYVWLHGVPLPMTEFFRGILNLAEEGLRGRRAFLLGRERMGGFWYFFPVAIFYKTPLAFLGLTLAGAVMGWREALRRRDWRPIAALATAMAILAVAMASRINIGLRHVLPIYPLLAITAGVAATRMWGAIGRGPWRLRRISLAVLLVALLTWHLAAGVRAHPDYLAYFNELAGSHPERILVDSDLDWGQDVLRLREELERRGVRQVRIALWFPYSERLLPNAVELVPYQPATGWIAVSEWPLRMGQEDPALRGAYRWLEKETPVARVGHSIRLYYLAPR